MILLKKLLGESVVDAAPIDNYAAYISGMKASLSDKVFFLHQIHPDLIVDFGCADGAVLASIHEDNPDVALVGYDLSPSMELRFKKNNPDIPFFSDWSQAKNYSAKFKKSCLLLSSVIHEVYSYSTSKEVGAFWDEVFKSGFKYVVIRDTIPKGIDSIRDYKHDVAKVRQVVEPSYLSDYERKWGSIESSYRNFVRFLLVYRYKDNWARESVENYLPLTYNTLIRRIPDDYTIIYDKSFKFKPVASSITKDYGVSLRKNTHLKMILKRK